MAEFVGGNEKKYDNFTDDELLLLAQQHDDALEFLMKKYGCIVRKKARTYFLIGADHEDIVQEGMIGLFKAIRDFNRDRHTSFRSFAELCITRQMITAVKTATRMKHSPLNSYVSLNRPLFDEEYEMTLLDVLGENARVVNPEEIMINREQYEDTERKLFDLLSDFEKRVLDLYLQGKSYQEISGLLEREPKSVDNALQRIKRKIEKMR